MKYSSTANLLYVLAAILIIGWIIGFVGYGESGIIHILLIIALAAILLRVVEGRNLY